MAEDIHRQLGALDARMDAVERDIREMKADVRETRDAMRNASSSWKALVFLGGTAAAIGALAMQFLSWLWARHP